MRKLRLPKIFSRPSNEPVRTELRPVRDERGYAGPITTSDGHGDDWVTRLTFFYQSARRFLVGADDAERFGRDVELFFPLGDSDDQLSAEEQRLIRELYDAATGWYGDQPLEPRLRRATEALWLAAKGRLPS